VVTRYLVGIGGDITAVAFQRIGNHSMYSPHTISLTKSSQRQVQHNGGRDLLHYRFVVAEGHRVKMEFRKNP
jgi:hypothetical protein